MVANDDALDLLARVCHDLRHPAQAVIAYADLLQRAPADPERTLEWAARLRTAGAAIEELASALLALTAGEPVAAPGPVDVAAVVADVIALASPEAERDDVLLVVEGGDGVLARGDPARLRRVLANLVTNAIRHAAGGVVAVQTERSPAGAVRIAVSDSGPGIEEALVGRIGVPLARPGGGTALGLAIVSELVASMGGSLDVTSSPDAGTTFTVELLPAPAALVLTA